MRTTGSLRAADKEAAAGDDAAERIPVTLNIIGRGAQGVTSSNVGVREARLPLNVDPA